MVCAHDKPISIVLYILRCYEIGKYDLRYYFIVKRAKPKI